MRVVDEAYVEAVLSAVEQIPPGRVASYGDLAELVGTGGPRLVGAVAIRASFDAMFANGTIDARPEKVRRLDTHSTAVHSVLERVRVFGPDGEAFAYVVATNVYVKATRGWRLVAHHASPGTASEVPDIAETASILH